MSDTASSFFTKHEFLIRRLHSLSGLIPVGAYMTVHLVVNASLLNGPGTFQQNVIQIHALGKLLPLVEWMFIFLPIIFHAVFGIWIIKTGKSNHDNYRYVANWRYTLQRWSGVIAVLFIFTHVFHLHGWLHADWWMKGVAEPLGMAQFRAYSAASSLAEAMGGFVWPVFYAIGIVACVFHFANGVWTMGITWGVWISPKAQQRASYVCAAGGTLLLLIGMSALAAALTTDKEEAKRIEDAMYEAKVATGEIIPNPHKRTDGHSHSDESDEAEDSVDGETDAEAESPEAVTAAVRNAVTR
ncbi:MAG: succinate dehydrogenase cytochrome b558 subunit [Aureliella sp.]